MDKTTEMLIHTDRKIPEICSLVGYQNVEYFNGNLRNISVLHKATKE
ncbi:hypothetical protein R2R35_06295 [Anaerocolumna sp. AGMB13020]|nr:hypothetical protein [Anaerocolumna sp. AGMB13020]WOO38109.1 hypothetical protein R2R35_06295 [Anaerocolumna sp. AGMB13020]